MRLPPERLARQRTALHPVSDTGGWSSSRDLRPQPRPPPRHNISPALPHQRWRLHPEPQPPARSSRERSEEHTSELQSRRDLVCRLLLEKKKKKKDISCFIKKKIKIK